MTEPTAWPLATNPLLPQDLFSKSDPFLELFRINRDGSEQLVYRTEVRLSPTRHSGRLVPRALPGRREWQEEDWPPTPPGPGCGLCSQLLAPLWGAAGWAGGLGRVPQGLFWL